MNANAETSDRVVGAVVTIVLHAILFIVFLLMVVSVEIPEEPEGAGSTMEVSYGDAPEGSGNVESAVVAAQQEQQQASEPESNPEEQTLAANDADADVQVKKKQEKQKIKTEKTNNKKTDVQKTQQVDTNLAGLKNLIGGEGDGDSDKAGNEGANGENPGRGKGQGNSKNPGAGHNPVLVSSHTKYATHDCQEEGVQMVKVKINRQGIVVSATGNAKGTQNPDPCLRARAEKLAKEETYNADPKGPELREYTATFVFNLQ